MPQELLHSFGETLGEVTLIPDGSGGRFEIHAGEMLIWERVRDDGCLATPSKSTCAKML